MASLACGQPHYFSLIACCILLFAAFFLIVVALPINKSCCIFCLIAFHIISCCIIALHKLAAVFALIISFSCMPCCLFSSLSAHMYHVNLLHDALAPIWGMAPQNTTTIPPNHIIIAIVLSSPPDNFSIPNWVQLYINISYSQSGPKHT